VCPPCTCCSVHPPQFPKSQPLTHQYSFSLYFFLTSCITEKKYYNNISCSRVKFELRILVDLFEYVNESCKMIFCRAEATKSVTVSLLNLKIKKRRVRKREFMKKRTKIPITRADREKRAPRSPLLRSRPFWFSRPRSNYLSFSFFFKGF